MTQPVRGTRDLLYSEQLKNKYIIDTARIHAVNFGYSEIELPIFENTDIFHRLGATSDIITKETYTFLDRGNNSLTLRPEGTAQIARALVSNGLTQKLPCRFFNAGPMFRYERPQKGRYRQFTQASIEVFGINSYHADLETIQLAENFLHELNIHDLVQLQINSLGDKESRENYKEKLLQFLDKYKNDLSDNSKKRLQQNPLRILDSKDEIDKKILKSAPLYKESLNKTSNEFFDNIQNYLTQLGIEFTINYKLVRGLDYYCHTAFEYIMNDKTSQNAVLAGGRYNGLVRDLGGPDISGVGWAAGVERLALLSKKIITQSETIKILPLSQNAEIISFNIANKLRFQNIPTEIMYTGNLAKRLKKASKTNSKFAIIIGEQELTNEKIIVKNLQDSTEQSTTIEKLIDYLSYIKIAE